MPVLTLSCNTGSSTPNSILDTFLIQIYTICMVDNRRPTAPDSGTHNYTFYLIVDDSYRELSFSSSIISV